MAQACKGLGVISLGLGQDKTQMERDLAKYSHAHQIITISPLDGSKTLSRVDTPVNEPLPQMLFDIKGDLELEELAMVQGYEYHGIVKLENIALQEKRSDVGKPFAAPSLLDKAITEWKPAKASIPNTKLASLIDSFLSPTYRTQSASADGFGVLVTISTITIFVETLHMGEPCGATNEKSEILWKWAKPSSIYDVKSGFWEADISSAIKDGTQRGGKGLIIFARYVSLREKQAVKDGKRTF